LENFLILIKKNFMTVQNDPIQELNTAQTRYLEVRKRTEELCEPLQAEDFVPQPIIDVSPPKWNLGHTSWFFETFVLMPYLPGYKRFNEKYPYLFNSYYEHEGERVARHNRGQLTRPTVKEVYRYRAYVDDHMQLLLNRELSQDIQDTIELGLQHEQQHQELFLTDLKYTFSCNPIYPVYKKSILPESTSGEGKWIEMKEGVYEIGFDGEGFCFDNELGRHKVYLQDYAIMDRLVTVGEYMEFMEAGGYQNFRYWLSEGWGWVQENDIQSPLYWEKRDGQWMHFTLGGLQVLKPEAPLTHVSLFEADAYAAWKGYRLPTEFEWEAASAQFKHGQLWEWTNSAYLPYPGFEKAPGAIGEYNGKFMINQMVLRGSSVATAPGHTRTSYRNFFHPDKQWQFTGIRLAK
jgi:ergothioneine biosynthesis protein EgtB